MTPPSPDTITDWNIFAAELQTILAAHEGATLWSLQRAGVHARTISRLLTSLGSPKSFPILNAEEMSFVRNTFHLTTREFQRLMAAIMAASIEARLMNRMNQHLAYQATKRIFIALAEVIEQDSLLATLESGTLMDTQEEIVTVALTTSGIFALIDQAAFDLDTSQHTASSQEALNCAFLALEELKRAQDLFRTLSTLALETESVTYWQRLVADRIVEATNQVTYLTTGIDR